MATIGPDTSLAGAARKMRDQDVGCLPVVDGERLLGIITDRDIVLRGVAEALDPHRAGVREAMSTTAIAGSPEQTVEEAEEIPGSNSSQENPNRVRKSASSGVPRRYSAVWSRRMFRARGLLLEQNDDAPKELLALARAIHGRRVAARSQARRFSKIFPAPKRPGLVSAPGGAGCSAHQEEGAACSRQTLPPPLLAEQPAGGAEHNDAFGARLDQLIEPAGLGILEACAYSPAARSSRMRRRMVCLPTPGGPRAIPERAGAGSGRQASGRGAGLVGAG